MRKLCAAVLLGMLCFSTTSCLDALKKKKDKDAAAVDKKPDMRDQNNDVSFQSFIGRLRLAAANRDMDMIASMMSPDFGHRWDDAPPDENVFAYWDANNVWPELVAVLNDKFVPSEDFMVAPPEMVQDAGYGGYRAGLKLIQGSWKFVYFVRIPPGS